MDKLTDVPAVRTVERLSVAPLAANKDHSSRTEILISFFVACFNEEENIYGALETLARALANFDGSYEIIVVDDASRDASVDEVRRFQRDRPDLPVELIVRKHNFGLALNYVECAFRAKGTWFRLICGDNIEDVETLRSTLTAIGSADMVLAYPRRRVGFSATRNIISKTYTRLVNLITGYQVRYYNFPAVHRRANILRWHSRSRGFSFQADLIAQLLDQGASYVEIPIVATERANGQSTALNLRNFLSVGHSLVEMAARRFRRRLFGTPPMTRPSLVASPPKDERPAGRISPGIIVKVTVSAALCGALVLLSDVSGAATIMAQVSPPLFGAAVLATTGSIVLGALRWWLILSSGEDKVDPMQLCRINFVASFLGQALPAGVGVDGTRVVMLRARGVATSRALAAVALDRAFLLAVLLAVCGFALLTRGGPQLLGAGLCLAAPLPVLGLVVLSWLARAKFVPVRIARATGFIAGPARSTLASPTAVIGLLALSIASYANLALCASLLARGTRPSDWPRRYVSDPAAGPSRRVLTDLFGGMGVARANACGQPVTVRRAAGGGSRSVGLFGLVAIIGTAPGLALWLTGDQVGRQSRADSFS